MPKLCDTYTNSCQCDPSPAEETIMDQLSKDCQDVYHVDKYDNYDNNDDGDYYDVDTNYANHAIRHIAEGNDDRCRGVLTTSKTNCPLHKAVITFVDRNSETAILTKHDIKGIF